ncbi:Formamidopyrimidine-DNA glycosylase [Rickettsiales bacterium Ac37b]|nr:Formamidopyrimidine-DNA glycosylase [Rickettsiales bacterium Ac37b]
MPELPEVETVSRGLKKEILGHTIDHVIINNVKLREPIPSNLSEIIAGAQILDILRKAKYILCQLNNGYTLIFHLGMTGKLLISFNPYIPDKHDHAIFQLSNNKNIIFNDVRRFGLITITESDKLHLLPIFNKPIIEPLSDQFNIEYLTKKLKNKQIPIKMALMDNSVVVGVGNIYSNEALFRAKINPRRASNTLTLEELSLLITTIKNILIEAINLGGSTFRDYTDASGKTGNFQNKFTVYNRYGKNCMVCSGVIERIKQGGRSTFYCIHCQI